jgi:hypothetical protein
MSTQTKRRRRTLPFQPGQTGRVDMGTLMSWLRGGISPKEDLSLVAQAIWRLRRERRKRLQVVLPFVRSTPA